MSRVLIFIFSILSLSSGVFAAESHASRRVFVVETDAKSAQESLNRVSGEIELGFSKSDQTFKSTDHYSPGPFARQEQAEKIKV